MMSCMSSSSRTFSSAVVRVVGPHYWIVDFAPVARIEALDLERGRYVRNALVTGDEVLVVERPFEISVTPNSLYELGRRDFA